MKFIVTRMYFDSEIKRHVVASKDVFEATEEGTFINGVGEILSKAHCDIVVAKGYGKYEENAKKEKDSDKEPKEPKEPKKDAKKEKDSDKEPKEEIKE